MAQIKIGSAGDVAPGEIKTVTAGGKTLAVANVNGVYYAVDNTCAHRGGPLGEGVLEGTVVTCPWHGWQYEMTTGQCVVNPQAKVASYPVQQVGQDLLVEL